MMPQPLKNMSNIVCGPAQDRPLRSADFGRKQFLQVSTRPVTAFGGLW